ncbi:MAG: DUF853 family protein [Rhodobacter sp.]|nr:DUF853 family protein [Rhodobacter sp.]
MLSDLLQMLAETGAPELTNPVFFLDGAHRLFRDAPKLALDRVEQVACLIRHCSRRSFVVKGAAQRKDIMTGTGTPGPAAGPDGFRTPVIIPRDAPAGIETCVCDGSAAAAQGRDLPGGAAHLRICTGSGPVCLSSVRRQANNTARPVARKFRCDPTPAGQRPSGLDRLQVEKLPDTVCRHRAGQPADTVHRLCHGPGAVEHVQIGLRIRFGLFVQ